MRFRILASCEDYSVESIVDGLAARRERLRAFRAIPGLIELRDEPYAGSEPSGTWLNLHISVGAAR